MRIVKRDKTTQQFTPNKILTRIKTQSKGLKIDSDKLFQEVIPLINDNTTTTEIDEIIAFKAADKVIQHPDYSLLGGRILLSRQSKLINKTLQDVDLTYDFFAATTFLSKYSIKDHNKTPLELPSCMYERVGKTLYGDDIDSYNELMLELKRKKGNFATPTYTNCGVEKRGGMISCFTEDTLVNTSKGLIKISEIKEGDLVLTHNNRFRKVNEVYKNHLLNREVKSVKVYRTKEIKCTDNHEFLSYTNEDKRLNLTPSFKPIKWLRVGDYVKGSHIENFDGMELTIDVLDYVNLFKENWYEFKATKNTEIIDLVIENDDEFVYVNFTFKKQNGSIQKGRTNGTLKRFIKIDDNFCKFLGMYYGDGHIQRSKGSGFTGIGITAKRDSDNVTKFVKDFTLEYFGIETKIYNYSKDDRSWKKLMINSKPLSILWKHLFGATYSAKFIPEFINNLGKSKIDNLIAGLISSDGNVTKEGEIRVQIANKKLLEGFHNLGRKFNYNTGITKASTKKDREQQYRLDYGIDSNLLSLIVKDYGDDRLYKDYSYIKEKTFIRKIGNDFFYRINDIKTINIDDEFVYDLNVDEDHSYSVENIVVHNCNLTHLKSDSFEGIEETLTKIASASKEGSGIGLLIDPLRSKDSLVESFQGNAGGVIRLADMVQSKMRFYKQGSRSGSCALYLSLWHRDIIDFLQLTLPIGDEQMRTRDLFTAVVVNDLFMEKLEKSEDWYLFCPNEILKAGLKPLHDLWGQEFNLEYQKAVDLGLGKKINPKDIFDAIIKSQVESGKPYVLYKDNANKRNMQSNIGVIKQSNLCIEVLQASKPMETPQCTLASVNLSEHDDLESIAKTTKILVKALNRVIDINKWSDEWSEKAGLDQRALAIGVAGLADFFAKKKISFESEEAKQWNKDIFETMYKASVTQSMELAIKENRVYPSWDDSPYSKGETYIEGWSPLPLGQPIPVLNSLFLGLMPTASSAILLGVFESFEPPTSNLFTRRVGQGEFLIVNKYLVNELFELDLWNQNMIDKILKNKGSLQNITEIPEDIRYRFKDVWEIPQKTLLDLSIIRNKYVDQSQSLNVYHADAKYGKIASALMYGWKGGLKTGVYYTRTKSKLETNSKLASNQITQLPEKPKDSPFECFGCSS